jgi:murein L,D-transpeptidase YafK
VVYKEARTLAVYREGRMYKRYPVVLGKQPKGTKRFEGDMRTPEGLYWIDGKQAHPRWAYFMSINYPNDDDRRAYSRASEEGSLPEIAGRLPSIGGAIGIHGTDRTREQLAGIDWTRGCIALRNEHIAELYSLVNIGTPVLLLP